MRLWHKDLIPVLPRKQLAGQWRECCLIAKNIYDKGTPNHVLVNKIMDYEPSHFYNYCLLVAQELSLRYNYKCDWLKIKKYFTPSGVYKNGFMQCIQHEELFKEWHDDRYLWQCYYNLQEKHDCGAINDKEWKPILDCCWDRLLRR